MRSVCLVRGRIARAWTVIVEPEQVDHDSGEGVRHLLDLGPQSLVETGLLIRGDDSQGADASSSSVEHGRSDHRRVVLRGLDSHRTSCHRSTVE